MLSQTYVHHGRVLSRPYAITHAKHVLTQFFFVASHMYPENPEETRVIVDSMTWTGNVTCSVSRFLNYMCRCRFFPYSDNIVLVRLRSMLSQTHAIPDAEQVLVITDVAKKLLFLQLIYICCYAVQRELNWSLSRLTCNEVCACLIWISNVVTDVSLEDSGNYTCEIHGRRSVVLAQVTHSVYVRG